MLLIRRIRDLLYEQGFTISGARNRLTEAGPRGQPEAVLDDSVDVDAVDLEEVIQQLQSSRNEPVEIPQPDVSTIVLSMPQMRQELISIRGLLAV